MSLKSELFRGDARLENAAKYDSAHVVLGSSGVYVEKIQLALMLLDNATIASNELVADLYGKSTAEAVLAYKRKRKIINPSYQTTADNIVGKMTMASLDQEMVNWESRRKRRGCNYYPIGQILQKQHFWAFAPVAAQQNVGAPPAQTTLDMALAAVPDASSMRNAAKEALDDVIKGSNTPARTLALAALDVHYKVSAPSDVDRIANDLRNSLAQIASRLLSSRAWLRQGQGGGFAETPEPRDGHTYIMRDYATAGRLMRPTILIHEAFHDIDGFNQDVGGNPARDQGAAYHRNDTKTQLKNPYGMSQFVLHINVGRERFLGDTE